MNGREGVRARVNTSSEKTTCAVTPEPATEDLFGAGDISRGRLLLRNLCFFVASVLCTATSAILFLTVETEPWPSVARWFTHVGVGLGYPLFWSALRTLALAPIRRKLTTEVFVTLALVAVLYAGEYWYASWVVTILWLGEVLMAWVGRRSRSAMEQLIRLMPREARVVSDGDHEVLPIERVRVGDVVAVYPGERIPVDGIVVRGETSVDQSMLTGESVPVDRGMSDEVSTGTFNLLANIHVRTQRPVAENAVARIIRLMRQAQRERVPLQRVVERFLSWFLPLVLLAAGATWAWTGAVERAAAILLVITPCAFAASTPLALVATVGNAARRGIVTKGAASIEALDRSSVMLLDKTGTLTASTPQVVGLEVFSGTEQELLKVAAIAEKSSAHPLARAIVAAAIERDLAVPEPDGFEVVTGSGVRAPWQGQTIRVGNDRFLAREGLAVPETVRQRAATWQEEGHTVVYVACDDEVLGFVSFLAAPRGSANAVVEGLRGLGFERIVMITGDHERAARAVAGQLGLEYRAEVSPKEKLDEVLRWKNDGYAVAMVGDGINDATALAAADAGIAMGGAGAEIAASAADVVIQNERFGSVLAAARLARRGVRTIRLNIFLAIVFNLVGLPLAMFGVITPAGAALFHAASFVSVVANSALVINYNPRVVPEDDESAASFDAAVVQEAA